MKVPVSVIVPIKNEAKNLPICLESIQWADEIFVVDSQSTDGSQEIAEKFGAKVIQFKFNGVWPKKRNWALDNLTFKHQWIFILDADEALLPEAEEELRKICTGNSQGKYGYYISRRFLFMGKWLNHAYRPNWVLRLVKHGRAHYEKLIEGETSSYDNEVHEPFLLNGKAGYLKSEIKHFAFPTVESFIEKHIRYVSWEARVALANKKSQIVKSSGLPKRIIIRQRVKELARQLPCRPLLRFLYIYVWQKGFLDGREGYYFARLHAYYEFLSVVKTYEIKKTRKPTC